MKELADLIRIGGIPFFIVYVTLIIYPPSRFYQKSLFYRLSHTVILIVLFTIVAVLWATKIERSDLLFINYYLLGSSIAILLAVFPEIKLSVTKIWIKNVYNYIRNLNNKAGERKEKKKEEVKDDDFIEMQEIDKAIKKTVLYITQIEQRINEKTFSNDNELSYNLLIEIINKMDSDNDLEKLKRKERRKFIKKLKGINKTLGILLQLYNNKSDAARIVKVKRIIDKIDESICNHKKFILDIF